MARSAAAANRARLLEIAARPAPTAREDVAENPAGYHHADPWTDLRAASAGMDAEWAATRARLVAAGHYPA